MEADCEETGVVDNNKSCKLDNFNCKANFDIHFNSDVTTGEPGAGLEYDLWEGQFQFLEHCPLPDHNSRQNCPSASLEQVRKYRHHRSLTLGYWPAFIKHVYIGESYSCILNRKIVLFSLVSIATIENRYLWLFFVSETAQRGKYKDGIIRERTMQIIYERKKKFSISKFFNKYKIVLLGKKKIYFL